MENGALKYVWGRASERIKTLRKRGKAFLFILSLPLLFLVALAGWKVDVFRITDDAGDTIISCPVALGQRVITGYIHSVELTPVEDEYRVLDGKIWMWEERVRSSNAGLPSMKPQQGRFIQTDDWLVYQGGRTRVRQYYYRIGNSIFGLNRISFAQIGCRKLYEAFKGERLTVGAERMPFIAAQFIVSDRLESCNRAGAD